MVEFDQHFVILSQRQSQERTENVIFPQLVCFSYKYECQRVQFNVQRALIKMDVEEAPIETTSLSS